MTMQRARRLASVVVVASLGVAGLSACQQAPTVAAYLGSLGQISESQVQDVWDDAHSALLKQAQDDRSKQQEQLDAQARQKGAKPSASATQSPVKMPVTRAQIVQTLILDKVLDQVAAKNGLNAAPGQEIDQDATAIQLPSSTQFVQLYAHWNSVLTQMRIAAQTGPAPSDEDLKTVFQGLTDAGVVPKGSTLDQFKAQLQQDTDNATLVRVATTTRDQIQQVIKPLAIKVSPRYQPLSLTLLSTQTQSGAAKELLGVPLGSNDASAPVDPAS
jgi:hypothetical protein